MTVCPHDNAVEPPYLILNAALNFGNVRELLHTDK